MAYIFHEDDLPKLVSVVPGRERTFFVNKELTKIDDMLAGIMHYVKGASSPYHLHKNCEHFYFIMEGQGTVESEEGTRDVGPGDISFHSRRGEASPASLQNTVVLFRISGAEPLRHHDSGRDTRRPSLEPRRGRRLGSDLRPRSDQRRVHADFHRYE